MILLLISFCRFILTNQGILGFLSYVFSAAFVSLVALVVQFKQTVANSNTEVTTPN